MEENKDNNDKNEEISIEKSNKKPSNNNGNKNIKKDLSLSDNSPSVIKNLSDKGYFVDLKNIKGEELMKERQKFLGIK